jgi:hypothetical protein
VSFPEELFSPDLHLSLGTRNKLEADGHVDRLLNVRPVCLSETPRATEINN